MHCRYEHTQNSISSLQRMKGISILAHVVHVQSEKLKSLNAEVNELGEQDAEYVKT